MKTIKILLLCSIVLLVLILGFSQVEAFAGDTCQGYNIKRDVDSHESPYIDDYVTIYFTADTASWSANEGYEITAACVKIGGLNSNLITFGGGNGSYTKDSYDISHVAVSYDEIKGTPVPTEETPIPTEETPVPTEETPVPTEETPVPTEEPPKEETPVPTEEPPKEETPVPTEETSVPTEEPPKEETPVPTEEEKQSTSPQVQAAPTFAPTTGPLDDPIKLIVVASSALITSGTSFTLWFKKRKN